MAATLAACGTPERAPPPDIVIPSGPPAESARPPRPEPPTRPLLPAPHPEVQQFLPGPPADAIGRGPAPVPRPSPVATPLPYAPNLGPVTGYGTGGMALPPGAPPNPPYPPGGLLH